MSDPMEVLNWHEQRREAMREKFRASGRTHFGTAIPAPLGMPWKPVMSAEDRAELEREIKELKLPF